MTAPWGNQHCSRKQTLLGQLDLARMALDDHWTRKARYWLNIWRSEYAKIPASTKRRWRCGK